MQSVVIQLDLICSNTNFFRQYGNYLCIYITPLVWDSKLTQLRKQLDKLNETQQNWKEYKDE